MTAQEALALTNTNSYRNDALAYGIADIESRIKRNAEAGKRSCLVGFRYHPGEYKKFEAKYGVDKRDDYCQYNVEREITEYFVKNGFSFKLITNDICGGVRQDPYWTICW